MNAQKQVKISSQCTAVSQSDTLPLRMHIEDAREIRAIVKQIESDSTKT